MNCNDTSGMTGKVAEFANRLGRLRHRLSQVVRTQQVDILDESGVTRANCSGRGGFVSVGLNGAEGFIRADLAVRDDGMPRLSFYGEPRALVEIAVHTEVGDGIPFLMLRHCRTQCGLELGQSIDTQETGLFFLEKDDSMPARLVAGPGDNPLLSLRGSSGRGETIRP